MSIEEQSLQLRTQLLRRVAHDIASPTGVTMTVLDELASATQPRPELLAMARRSLKRLMRLSEQLALCAELETGGLEAETTAADLRQVTKTALDDAVGIDGRKDVTTQLTLPETSVLLPLDGRLLTTVIREAIGNALKLASSKVQVSLTMTAEHAVIRIDDDGPGFSAESASTLGRRFVTRASSRGLGLSLSMAKEVLAMHGGELAIDKSPLLGRRGGPGASVIITLPA